MFKSKVLILLINGVLFDILLVLQLQSWHEYPSLQTHSNVVPSSLQTPPFLQGLFLHRLIFSVKNGIYLLLLLGI